MGLRIALLKVPRFEGFLRGNESSASWIVAEKVEPLRPLVALEKPRGPAIKEDQLVAIDNVCEAYIDSESETASCASPSDSYTLTQKCSKCGTHRSTHPLKDQLTQTMTLVALGRECLHCGKYTNLRPRDRSTQTPSGHLWPEEEEN